jgi:proline dehydrogenase
MALLERALLTTLPFIPRPIVRKLASRYIAGEELGEAMDVLRSLAARGHPGILDILGEEVRDEAEARDVLVQYRSAAEAVAGAGLDAYVSVKPTHLGLRLSEALCEELYADLADHCAGLGVALRVEMEDHTTTDATLRLFERTRSGRDNVGLVLQSRLLRTPRDIDALGPGPLWVRMVKGIYLEPGSIAHTEPEPIREAFVDCVRQLFERGARISLATHDEGLAERLVQLAGELEVPADRWEFQVLLGVREPLWTAWREAGHTVRVYVPYGPEWRAYSLRRMKKNPELVRHVVRQTLGLS